MVTICCQTMMTKADSGGNKAVKRRTMTRKGYKMLMKRLVQKTVLFQMKTKRKIFKNSFTMQF